MVYVLKSITMQSRRDHFLLHAIRHAPAYGLVLGLTWGVFGFRAPWKIVSFGVTKEVAKGENMGALLPALATDIGFASIALIPAMVLFVGHVIVGSTGGLFTGFLTRWLATTQWKGYQPLVERCASALKK